MKPLILSAFIVSSLLSITGLSAAENLSDDDLLNMSLEELISMEVTSVSRKKQRLMDSAAAVYVLSREDIQRSGVTTLADALRMVPGMQVAQMNSNSWSISARGFNYIFANKLLVLMDGRTLYTPLFSGVTWDVQDTLLEDVDRIEVIRGPGAALWGANAVNGVINIITRKADATQGRLVTVGAGSQEKQFGQFRQGGQLNSATHYRVYAKSFKRAGLKNRDGSRANDDWRMDRFGMRLDWQDHDTNSLALSADIYTGTTRPPLKVFDSATRTIPVRADQSRDQKGGNVIVRWNTRFSETSDFSIKAYYDSYDNYDYRIRTEMDTFDIESQHRYQWQDNQELIWGLGYRSTWYKLDAMNYVVIKDSAPKEELYSAYIQDELQLRPNWHLTLSARLEHHTATDYEFQPNARLAWRINDTSTVWASFSRAVRTPSIAERLSEINGVYRITDSALPPNTFLRLSNNDSIQSEKLTAMELGYRQQVSRSFSLDFATFYNQYDDLHSLTSSTSCPTDSGQMNGLCMMPGPYFLLPAQLGNGLDARTYGLELAVDWELSQWWRIKADVTLLRVDASGHDSAPFTRQTEVLVEGLSARHMANLRSMMNLPGRWFLDTWVRYMDHNKSANVRSYTRLNMRLAHQVIDDLEVALVGNNLFAGPRLEFDEAFTGLGATETGESWYAQVQWQF